MTQSGIDFGPADTAAAVNEASTIASDGYTFIGDYIGNAQGYGYLTSSDAAAFAKYNISIVSIFERSPDHASYFTIPQADSDATDAVTAAENVAHQTNGSAIYFTVDFDPESSSNPQAAFQAVDSYFEEIRSDLTSMGSPYQLGVYGPGDVLSRLVADPAVAPNYTWMDSYAWPTYGFSGQNIQRIQNAAPASPNSIGFNVDLDSAFGTSFGQWTGSSSTSTLTVTTDNVLSVGVGRAATISTSLLQATDSSYTASQLTYVIISAPVHGSVVDNGGIANGSFTQSDINNGLVQYQENGDPANSDSFTFEVFDPSGNHTATTNFDIQINPCYCGGTHIATRGGEVSVEDLREGDLVITASGKVKPIVWIGQRNVDCRRHPRPEAVWPIRIRAGAFGDARPRRDLRLSPDHAVFVDGVLIPIKYLINGTTVVQERVDAVHYFHVELERHDVLLAEGLPAESYLDTGNRAAFANGTAHMDLHPDFSPLCWDEACAPLCTSGAGLFAAKRLLIERMIERSGLHVRVGGRAIRPAAVRGHLHRFLLPWTAREIQIASHCMPAEDADGRRQLGVCLEGILLDGRSIPLDSPTLAHGFYRIEQDSQASWRWTDGEATLRLEAATGPRLLELLVRDVTHMRSATKRELISFAA